MRCDFLGYCRRLLFVLFRAENAVKNRYNSLINRRWTEEMFTNAESAMQAQIYSGKFTSCLRILGVMKTAEAANHTEQNHINHVIIITIKTGAGMGAAPAGRGGHRPRQAGQPPQPPRRSGPGAPIQSRGVPFANTAATPLSFADLASNTANDNPDFKTGSL